MQLNNTNGIKNDGMLKKKKKENNQVKIRGDHMDQYGGGYLLLTHVLTQLDRL